MKAFRMTSAIVATAACLAAGHAQAQNLVPNPGFDKVKVVDNIQMKAGFAFDCQIVDKTDAQVKVKTRVATITKDMKDIAKITKRDTPEGWTFYEIVLPVAYVVDKTQGHAGAPSFKFATDKGKGFLHSTPFAVKAGDKYELSGWVKGKGKASLELLWWTKYSDEEIGMCKHHQDVLPAVQATDQWQRLAKVFTAPEGATKVYVRLVGEAADVWFDDISVAAAK